MGERDGPALIRNPKKGRIDGADDPDQLGHDVLKLGTQLVQLWRSQKPFDHDIGPVIPDGVDAGRSVDRSLGPNEARHDRRQSARKARKQKALSYAKDAHGRPNGL